MELQCLILPNFYRDDQKKPPKKIYQKKKYRKKQNQKKKQQKTTKNRVFVGISSIANFKRFILTCNQKRKSEIT